MFWHFAARVAAAALSLPALLFALRFFQQTGYNVARGYIRIALSRCFVCGAICVALLVPVEILLGDYSDAVLAGCSFASAAVALSVRAKVPLKFTRARDKAVCRVDSRVYGRLSVFAELLTAAAALLVILPCALLLLPFERSINAKYIRQAEQKLSRAAYIKIAVTGLLRKNLRQKHSDGNAFFKVQGLLHSRLFQYASRHSVLRQQRPALRRGGGCF